MLLVSGSLWAATPQPALNNATNYTLGAGTSDTTSISSITLNGDSVGFVVEINQDSVSGEIRYQYVSPSGYTDTTAFANLPVLIEFPSNSKGNFTTAIPRIAGTYQVRLYFILTNNKASLQTFTRTLYTVTWR